MFRRDLIYTNDSNCDIKTDIWTQRRTASLQLPPMPEKRVISFHYHNTSHFYVGKQFVKKISPTANHILSNQKVYKVWINQGHKETDNNWIYKYKFQWSYLIKFLLYPFDFHMNLTSILIVLIWIMLTLHFGLRFNVALLLPSVQNLNGKHQCANHVTIFQG